MRTVSEAVKVAQSQERQELIRVAGSVLTNPAIIAVAGTILIEYLQGHDVLSYDPVMRGGGVVHDWQKKRVPGGGFVGSVAGSTIEVGLALGMAAASIQEASKAAGTIIDVGKVLKALPGA